MVVAIIFISARLHKFLVLFQFVYLTKWGTHAWRIGSRKSYVLAFYWTCIKTALTTRIFLRSVRLWPPDVWDRAATTAFDTGQGRNVPQPSPFTAAGAGSNSTSSGGCRQQNLVQLIFVLTYELQIGPNSTKCGSHSNVCPVPKLLQELSFVSYL